MPEMPRCVGVMGHSSFDGRRHEGASGTSHALWILEQCVQCGASNRIKPCSVGFGIHILMHALADHNSRAFHMSNDNSSWAQLQGQAVLIVRLFAFAVNGRECNDAFVCTWVYRFLCVRTL